MTVSGDEILADRKRRGMSRRVYVQMLGHPWTESKLNNVEAGRRAVKDEEERVIRPYLDGAPTPEAGAAVPQTAVHTEVAAPRITIPNRPHGTVTINAPWENRPEIVAAYNQLLSRSPSWTPAPPYGLPSQYRPDTCPPEDLVKYEAWITKCHEWFDQVEAQARSQVPQPIPVPTTPTAPTPNGIATVLLNEEEEVHFVDPLPDEAPTPPASSAVAPGAHANPGATAILPPVIPPVPHAPSDGLSGFRGDNPMYPEPPAMPVQPVQPVQPDAVIEYVSVPDPPAPPIEATGVEIPQEWRTPELTLAPGPTSVPVEKTPPAATHGAELTTVPTPVEAPPVAYPGTEQISDPGRTPDISPVGKQALWLEDGTRRLSNSEIQTFKHCRRRWWLSWYRGLRLKLENFTGYAQLGTRVHEALAEWYVPDGTVKTDPREALERVLSRDEATLLQTTRTEDGDIVAAQLTEFKKEADLARAMIDGYMEWIAETAQDQGYRVIAPETVLSSVIEAASNQRFTFTGKLDVRLEREHDRAHLFMDHKTVGDFKQPVKTLPLDEQMKLYHLLEIENQAFTNDGSRTDGALYNMIRRVKRTATANPPFFERLEVRHNPHVIDSFKERLKGEALTIAFVEHCLDEGVDHHLIAFPSPGRDCTWRCEFTALCSMLDDGSRAEDFISEHYVSVNPMNRYDQDEVKG